MKKNLSKWQRAILDLISEIERFFPKGFYCLQPIEINHKYSFICRFFKFLFREEYRKIYWFAFEDGKYFRVRTDYVKQWETLKEQLQNIVGKDWAHDNQRNPTVEDIEEFSHKAGVQFIKSGSPICQKCGSPISLKYSGGDLVAECGCTRCIVECLDVKRWKKPE